MKLLSLPLVTLAAAALLSAALAFWLQRLGWLRRDYHRDVLALALLGLLSMLFFWRPIFEPNAWIPSGGGDMASMLYPNYRFVSESLWRGELPLWNPYLFCGQPFAADIQTAVLYPVNLLFWALNRNVTYHDLEWLVVFHIFLAGAFTYALLRAATPPAQAPIGHRPIGRLACLAGSVAYMFSDFFVTHVGNLNLIAVAAWLPLVVLLLHRAVTELRLGYAAAAGLAMAVAFLAGHIQPFLYAAVAVALYSLLQVYWRASVKSERPHLGRLLVVLAVFALVSLGAIAVQLLPSRELADLSVRSEMTYEDSAQYSLPPSQLVSLLVPDFFGRGPQDYWGHWPRTETGYIGVLPLIAAALAVGLRRERFVRFLAALALLGLCLALGGYTVLQGWMYELAPGFDRVRAPARFILLFDFAVAGLCALGVDVLLRPLRERERAVVSWFTRVLGAVALFAALVLAPAAVFLLQLNREQPEQILKRVADLSDGFVLLSLLLLGSFALLLARQRARARRSTVGLLALGIIAFDLISFGHDLEVTTKDPTAGYQQWAVVEFLRGDPGLHRIDTDTNVWDIWQPNAGPLHGIQEVQGGQHPLELASFRRYWSALGSRSTPLYDLLNVKYIIGRKGVPLDLTKWELAFDGDPQFSVYRNVNFTPRAFVVHRSVVEPSPEGQLTLMQSTGFDPMETVVVESGPSLSGAAFTSSANVVSYRNSEVVVNVQSAGLGYLVLSDMYFPGWRASVNGQDVPVLRADYAFRAVPIGPGSQQVRLSYQPITWKVGGVISGLTWLAVLAWGALALIQSRRASRRAAHPLASPGIELSSAAR